MSRTSVVIVYYRQEPKTFRRRSALTFVEAGILGSIMTFPSVAAAAPQYPEACNRLREGGSLPATATSLIPCRWTHGDELESGALGPCSVVVHPTRDIVD